MVTMPIKSDFEPMPQELLEMSDVEVNKKFQSIDVVHFGIDEIR